LVRWTGRDEVDDALAVWVDFAEGFETGSGSA
jgi:hypothetical protein